MSIMLAIGTRDHEDGPRSKIHGRDEIIKEQMERIWTGKEEEPNRRKDLDEKEEDVG